MVSPMQALGKNLRCPSNFSDRCLGEDSQGSRKNCPFGVNETLLQMYGSFLRDFPYNRPAHPNLQLTKYLEVPNRRCGQRSFPSTFRGNQQSSGLTKMGTFLCFPGMYGTFEGFTSKRMKFFILGVIE